jgi:hypothetical protein
MLFGLNKVTPNEPAPMFTSYTVALLSNTLNLAGMVYYFYLMFRGYGILPFVRKPQKYLMAVPFFVVALALMTLMGLNSWNILLRFTII